MYLGAFVIFGTYMQLANRFVSLHTVFSTIFNYFSAPYVHQENFDRTFCVRTTFVYVCELDKGKG